MSQREPYAIEETEIDEVKTLILTGDDSLAGALNLCSKFIALQDSGVDRILVISRLSGEMSPLEFYEIEQFVREKGLSRNTRIAFVNENKHITYDAYAFGETVAQNSGWLNVRVFRAMSDALTFLREP